MKENVKTKGLPFTDVETVIFLCLKQVKGTPEKGHGPGLVFLCGQVWLVLEVHTHGFPHPFNASGVFFAFPYAIFCAVLILLSSLVNLQENNPSTDKG